LASRETYANVFLRAFSMLFIDESSQRLTETSLTCYLPTVCVTLIIVITVVIVISLS